MLAGATTRLLAGLDCLGFAYEVILAENGSTDATYAIAAGLARQHPHLRVLHLDEANYGQAMRQGFLQAAGDYAANFSIDFVDLDFLQAALARLQDYDLVLGCKYLAQGQDLRPLPRQLAGQALSALVRLAFAIPFADTHGLLAFRREGFGELLGRCRAGYEVFDTELIVRAHRAGKRICQLPLRVEETRPSRLGAARRGLRMLRHYGALRVALWREGLRQAPGRP